MTRLRPLLVVAIVLAVLIFGIALPLDLNFRWYHSVGYDPVFWFFGFAPTLVSVSVFLVAFLLSLWLLKPLRRLGAERLPWNVPHRARGILVTASIIVASLIGLIEAGLIQWKTLILAFHASPFPYTDPTFHQNAAFYVFQLPFLFQLLSAALTFIILHGVLRLLSLIAVLRGLIADPVRDFRLLRWPLALLFFGFGVEEWLRRYRTVTGHILTNPQTHELIVAGPSFVTIHWTLAMMAAFSVVLVVVGFCVLATGRWMSLSRLGTAFVVLFAGSGAAAVAGQLVVGLPANRNAQTAQRPYMAETIKATRFAYGLANATVKPYPGNAQITAADITRDRTTLQNVRLADPTALQAIFGQLQTFRQYYTFPIHDVTINRYFSKGQPVEILLAPREIDPRYAGQGSQQGLLQYTHGYGVVASKVTQFDKNGLPVLSLKNMPVQGSLPGGITVTHPRIYYGEDTTTDVIAPNALGEFDYLKGQQSSMNAYQGPGILFDPHRLLIALTKGLGYLWQGETQSNSKFLMHRQIFDRVSLLAPWLHLDPKANLIVRKNGSLVWLLNGYTESRFFPDSAPYATPVGTVNYLRNSVKVTVNAATGTVRFYAVGKDPIRDAWTSLFPGLMHPLSAMPEDIRSHIVYPKVLFNTQARVLSRFHVFATDAFYSGSNNWALPQELRHQNQRVPMPSEQIVARVPGTSKLDFMRVLPFVPPNRPNMVGWMAALEDGSDYGHLLLYSLSSGSLIPGPMQVEAEFSQKPSIASQITLLDQHGSTVIRGDMLEIPVGQGMLAIEPLYTESSQNAMPELQEVLVAYNNQVTMAPTLGGALSNLFGKTAGLKPSAPPSPSVGNRTGLTPALRQLLSRIVTAENRLTADMKLGQWTGVGSDQAAIQKLIAQLQSQLAGTKNTTSTG